MVPPLIDGDAARALPRGELLRDAIPGEARAQFGELVGGIAAGEHVEHAIEDAAREGGVGRGAADQRVNSSSAFQASMATMATICCASTSSGLRG